MVTRASERFDPAAPIFGCFELTNEVTGEFPNREEFVIKNISMGGVNLLSNFPPFIGNSYRVLIHQDGKKHALNVKIVHSRILSFLRQSEGVFRSGVVYATGCQILLENDLQKNLIQEIIRNDCGSPAVP